MHNTDLLQQSRCPTPRNSHCSEHLRQLQSCLRHQRRVRARSRPSLVGTPGNPGAATAARRRSIGRQAREHREEYAQRRRGQHAVQEQLVGQQVPARVPPVSGAKARR